jgi:hypothetical protein
VIRIALASCIAAAFVVAVGAAAIEAPVSARGPSNSVTFKDETGEDAAGPDITSVTTSSNDREVSFRVSIQNRPTFSDKMRVGIRVDSDADPATKPDYVLIADTVLEPQIFRCSNPPLCDVFQRPAQSSLRFSYNGGATFTVGVEELGGTTRFAFAADAWDGLVYGSNDLTNVHWDFAPDHDQWWAYDTRALRAESFSSSPGRPAAGRRFALRLTAFRTDTGTTVTSGRVTCSLTVAGTPIKPVSRRFVSERAVCVFGIPAHSRGQRFRATISIGARGDRATRSLSGRIS